MGTSKSNYITQSEAKAGQKIVRAYGRDNSSLEPGSKSEQRMGKLKGSGSDLSHSITGGSVAAAPSRGGK